jgi:putative ABC transport system permease protein
VLGFVLAEAAALCLFGGVVGMSIATLFGALISKGTGGQFALSVNAWVWMTGLIAIVLMSLAVGLLPALRARRLKIVDALAGR